MTSTGTQGTGTMQVPGAGTQVTGCGTHGSVGSSTSAGAAGEGNHLHGTGVGPSCGPSSVRGAGRSDEQHEENVVPQEATSGRRRPKWLQDTLREARDAGESERVRRGKVPERFCGYIASVASITDSKPSSFQEAIDQQV